MSERICIAQIGGAHGIRGEVKLKSFTADPMAVKDYGLLEREDGGASLEIETVRPAKTHLVARFRGVSDRNAASGSPSAAVRVACLPPPSADEFTTPTVGLTAVTADGVEVRQWWRYMISAPATCWVAAGDGRHHHHAAIHRCIRAERRCRGRRTSWSRRRSRKRADALPGTMVIRFSQTETHRGLQLRAIRHRSRRQAMADDRALLQAEIRDHELQSRIRKAEKPIIAKNLADKHHDRIRPDWDAIKT